MSFFTRLLETQQTKDLRVLGARHRFDALKELKASARALQEQRFGQDEAEVEDRVFSDESEAVQRLLCALEAALFHGLKQPPTSNALREDRRASGGTGRWQLSADSFWDMLQDWARSSTATGARVAAGESGNKGVAAGGDGAGTGKVTSTHGAGDEAEGEAEGDVKRGGDAVGKTEGGAVEQGGARAQDAPSPRRTTTAATLRDSLDECASLVSASPAGGGVAGARPASLEHVRARAWVRVALQRGILETSLAMVLGLPTDGIVADRARYTAARGFFHDFALMRCSQGGTILFSLLMQFDARARWAFDFSASLGAGAGIDRVRGALAQPLSVTYGAFSPLPVAPPPPPARVGVEAAMVSSGGGAPTPGQGQAQGPGSVSGASPVPASVAGAWLGRAYKRTVRAVEKAASKAAWGQRRRGLPPLAVFGTPLGGAAADERVARLARLAPAAALPAPIEDAVAVLLAPGGGALREPGVLSSSWLPQAIGAGARPEQAHAMASHAGAGSRAAVSHVGEARALELRRFAERVADEAAAENRLGLCFDESGDVDTDAGVDAGAGADVDAGVGGGAGTGGEGDEGGGGVAAAQLRNLKLLVAEQVPAASRVVLEAVLRPSEAATAQALTELLLSPAAQEAVFGDVRAQVAQARDHICAKAAQWQRFHARRQIPVTEDDPEHVKLLQALFGALVTPRQAAAAREARGEVDAGAGAGAGADAGGNEGAGTGNSAEMDAEADAEAEAEPFSFDSPRWYTSGFSTEPGRAVSPATDGQARSLRTATAESPLAAFRGGGLLALQCLSFFMRAYREHSRAIILRLSARSAGDYPFATAGVHLVRMLLLVLGLSPPPKAWRAHEEHTRLLRERAQAKVDGSDGAPGAVAALAAATAATGALGPALPLGELASQPWWPLLDDADAFFRLFSMAFVLLDFNFVQSGASAMHGFQRVLGDTQVQMERLLRSGDRTVDALWLRWNHERERRQQEMAEARMRAAEETARRAEAVAAKAAQPEAQADIADSTAAYAAMAAGLSTDSAAARGNAADAASVAAPAQDEGTAEDAGTDGGAVTSGLAADATLTKSHMGLETRLLAPSDVFKAEHVPPLEAALPDGLQGFDWTLLYSLSRDGPSFETFYRCVDGHVSTLIAVNTAAGECFGGYASEAWKVQPSEQYYGAPDCFLFSFAGTGTFRCFGSSGANKFFQLANEDSIAMAAADAGAEDDEEDDLSVDFQCSNFEVWGFVPATANPMAM
eukprot:g1542.t1